MNTEGSHIPGSKCANWRFPFTPLSQLRRGTAILNNEKSCKRYLITKCNQKNRVLYCWCAGKGSWKLHVVIFSGILCCQFVCIPEKKISISEMPRRDCMRPTGSMLPIPGLLHPSFYPQQSLWGWLGWKRMTEPSSGSYYLRESLKRSSTTDPSVLSTPPVWYPVCLLHSL